MTGRLGEVGRRAAVRNRGRRIGTGRQEQLDHLDVAVLRRFVERGEPAVLGRVDVGPGRQQDPADLDMPSSGSRVERLVREVVGRERVDGRPRIDEEAGDLGLAEERRQVERREPVRRQPPDALGVVGEAGGYTWTWAIYGIPLIFLTGVVTSWLDRSPRAAAVQRVQAK